VDDFQRDVWVVFEDEQSVPVFYLFVCVGRVVKVNYFLFGVFVCVGDFIILFLFGLLVSQELEEFFVVVSRLVEVKVVDLFYGPAWEDVETIVEANAFFEVRVFLHQSLWKEMDEEKK